MPDHTPGPTIVRSRPVIFTAAEVRATQEERKHQFRRPITPSNSTVLGYPAKPYWPNLLFEHAVPMEKSTLMMAICGRDAAPRDIHLDVPFRHPEDPEYRVEELPVYRVRPIWEEGDRLWVKEAWALQVTGNYCDHGQLIFREGQYLGGQASLRRSDRVPMKVVYAADGPVEYRRSAAQMPRWASRFTLEVTEVRVQQLAEWC